MTTDTIQQTADADPVEGGHALGTIVEADGSVTLVSAKYSDTYQTVPPLSHDQLRIIRRLMHEQSMHAMAEESRREWESALIVDSRHPSSRGPLIEHDRAALARATARAADHEAAAAALAALLGITQ